MAHMNSQKLIFAAARIGRCHCRMKNTLARPILLTTIPESGCGKEPQVLQLNKIAKRAPFAEFSTGLAVCNNDKKFGQFLFGRPPAPNLDVDKSSIEASIEDLDPLSTEILNKLHNAETPSDLFEVFRENKSFMTEIHTSRALQQLAEMWDPRGGNVPMVINQEASLITAEPDFRELCVRCLRDAQHMDNFTFLRSVQSLLKIGVPENSALIHTLLTHASYRLNEMSAVDFAIFCQVVKSLKISNELAHALYKAIVMIVPRMIGKSEKLWQLLAYLNVAGNRLSAETRGMLLNKILALLKLDPTVTAADCFHTVVTLRSSNFQSKETLKELCRHLDKGYQELSNLEICRLIQVLGHFKYVDVRLMEKLTGSVCRLFEEELEESAFCNVLDGLISGRIYHPEVTRIGCRYVVESLSDEDLTVDLSVINCLARYMAEMNIRPDQTKEFVLVSAEVYRRVLSEESSPKELKSALDGFYFLCLLYDMKSPCTREKFEEGAAKFFESDTQRGAFFQNVVQELSVLRHLTRRDQSSAGLADVKLNFDLPNPWQGTQLHNLRHEKRILRKALAETLDSTRLECDVEIFEGLKADFVLHTCKEGEPGSVSEGNSKLAVNILPQEGQAANRSGHLVGLYHLKDRFTRSLGYETLWVEASHLVTEESEGNAAVPADQMMAVKEKLQGML